MEIHISDVHPWKALLTFLTDFGITIDVRDVQQLKAPDIFVTELGITIDESEEQPKKDQTPINLTELGIEIVFRF
jgi:hypothetical protein